MARKITIIHSRSGKKADVTSKIKQLTEHVTIVLSSKDPDMPLRVKDRYYLVIGGDSEEYKLDSYRHRNSTTKLELKN